MRHETYGRGLGVPAAAGGSDEEGAGMKRGTSSLAAGLVLWAVSLVGLPAAPAHAGAGAGFFELGDAAGTPGSADVRGGEDPGPDWDDLFTGEGSWMDADGDGVPDFLQFPGGQAAVFIADDVSVGVAIDTTARDAEGFVVNAVVSPQNDLGNSYVFSAQGADGLLLYAGTERLDAGDGAVEFEFNQDHFRLGHGPPWEITGSRLDGDLVVRVDFRLGTPAASTLLVWQSGAWAEVLGVSGEGCDLDGILCLYANAAEIESGPWPSFSGPDATRIPGERFYEFGVNVSQAIGFAPAYQTIQVRTPEDVAFGYFAEGN